MFVKIDPRLKSLEQGQQSLLGDNLDALMSSQYTNTNSISKDS